MHRSPGLCNLFLVAKTMSKPRSISTEKEAKLEARAASLAWDRALREGDEDPG